MQKHTLERSGIGLRACHARELLTTKTEIGFVEAHSENYFGGGQPRKILKEISQIYPVTLHGVGLSLGRADGLDQDHLRQIKSLVDDIDPVFVSEHLSWSGYSHIHVPDLLPVPYTNEALDIFVDHVLEFQDKIDRQILIENPSNYLAFANIDFTEMDFLNALVSRSDCGLLLDINNITVSAHNLGIDAKAYIDGIIDDGRVKQFHLAGYQINEHENGEKIYIDTHGKPVYPEVWELYAYALRRFGDVPTLIEWDTDIPALDVLIGEAVKADNIRAEVKRACHDNAA
ncbi:MAG: DUF692 domain-containing protein [Emcibacter sp.]|nr:DUF692 domain-containing protein [Emcibacter sp.]